MITALYDKHNPNWSEVDGQNQYFLDMCLRYTQDALQDKGFVTLNDVYDMLGLEKNEEGALSGWVGDVEVDFGISGGIGGEEPIELTFNINSSNVFRDK
jgi:hypothetical protein